jgi:hypothetical protein
MKKISTFNGEKNWNKIVMITVLPRLVLDADSLTRELGERLYKQFPIHVQGVTVRSVVNTARLEISWPDQCIDGKTLDEDMILSALESIEADVLKALEIRRLAGLAGQDG